jgi:hypothetical protein
MSLTYTAHVSRKIIKYGGLGIVAIAILWSLGTLGYKVYRSIRPPYTPPTIKYGNLPRIVFPSKEKKKKSFSFEFANDTIPSFKDQSRVYIIYRPNNSFLALEKDKETAKKFDFEGEPKEIRSGIYEFKNNDNKTLRINVLDGSFRMTYPYLEDQMLTSPKRMPSKSEVINIASAALKGGSKLTEDLENGVKEVAFFKIENNGLRPANSQAEANVARVNFYREKLDELDIISKNIDQASVTVLVSGSDVSEKKVLEIDYKDLNIDRESYSTYPIKSTEEAIADLNSGNYWPVSDVVNEKVVIRNVYLAYFEPVTLTNYLQAVFVFEGDNNFSAYVPAVSDQYTN